MKSRKYSDTVFSPEVTSGKKKIVIMDYLVYRVPGFGHPKNSFHNTRRVFIQQRRPKKL